MLAPNILPSESQAKLMMKSAVVEPPRDPTRVAAPVFKSIVYIELNVGEVGSKSPAAYRTPLGANVMPITCKLPPMGFPTRVAAPVDRSILASCAWGLLKFATEYAAAPSGVIAKAREPGRPVGPITVVLPPSTSIASSTAPA